MTEDTVLVGIILVGVVPFVVWDAVSSLRAGFDSSFWASPLQEKLPRVAENPKAWTRLGIVWIYIGVLLAAGFGAFALQLSAHGEMAWAAIGLGAFLLTVTAFVAAAALMTATISGAAASHARTGELPEWALPAWTAMWWIERAFVIGANLAYVAWGLGIVASGFPATWAGWVAIVSGALLAVWASLRDYFFQHMVLLTPIAVGIALLLV